jgi:hypothetical protein
MKSTLSVLGINSVVFAASFTKIEFTLKVVLLSASIILTVVKIIHELHNIKKDK